jgi:hypothetical protein
MFQNHSILLSHTQRAYTHTCMLGYVSKLQHPLVVHTLYIGRLLVSTGWVWQLNRVGICMQVRSQVIISASTIMQLRKHEVFIFVSISNLRIKSYMYDNALIFIFTAIMYYRQAVQLDPDVEFKAYRKPAKNGIE